MAKINLQVLPTKTMVKAQKDKIKAENNQLFEEIINHVDRFSKRKSTSIIIVFEGLISSKNNQLIDRLFKNSSNVTLLDNQLKIEDNRFNPSSKINAFSKGIIHIYNGSCYQELVNQIILEELPTTTINSLYDSINQFEYELIKNEDTVILKFYFHSSKHGIRDVESKNDLNISKAYEQIFQKCDQPRWHIIPSDRNWEKENFVARVILANLKRLQNKT